MVQELQATNNVAYGIERGSTVNEVVEGEYEAIEDNSPFTSSHPPTTDTGDSIYEQV